MKSTIALSLSTLTLAACDMKLPGDVTLPGGTSSGGARSSGAPSTAAAPSPDAPPSKPVGDLAPYYSSLELAALYQLIANERQDQIYERAKAAVGRDLLWQSPNPDPTWILFWRTKDWTNASENAEAMTQAAFNRSWEQSCVAEFAASRKAHADAAARLAPELARVDGLTNYYERMAGYVAVAAQFEDAMTAAGLPIDKDPFGPVGFRATVIAHAVAFHNGSPHGWTAFPRDQFPALGQMRDGTRELSDDVALERSSYCARVASRGGVATTPFTSIWSEGHMSASRVAWPTVTGDEGATRAKLAELTKRTSAQLEPRAQLRIENVEKTFGFGPPAEEPKLAGFREFKVTAVKGDVITATRTDAERYSYACRTTNRIDRIDDNGRLIYQQNCKSGEREFKLTVAATFAELPPGVTPTAGDVISFAADVDGDAKKVTKNSPAKQVTVRTFTATGRHLFKVKRGATTVW
ncbi:MAG: hypothetical protein IPL61_23350 [Myxococcales bacterium]|nr:hypothetical protein [Myxococcales bacterium]